MTPFWARPRRRTIPLGPVTVTGDAARAFVRSTLVLRCRRGRYWRGDSGRHRRLAARKESLTRRIWKTIELFAGDVRRNASVVAATPMNTVLMTDRAFRTMAGNMPVVAERIREACRGGHGRWRRNQSLPY